MVAQAEGGMSTADVTTRARPARSDFNFFETLRVRWAEVDAQNIVFNPHYYTYFDVASTEYWRKAGLDFITVVPGMGVDMVTRASSAQFHDSALFDDKLDIGVRLKRLGRSSLTFEFACFRGDALLVEGELVYVVLDMKSRKPVPAPQAMLDGLAKIDPIPD